MPFNEIYGSYYNAVAAVLSEALDGNLTDSRLTQLVQEKAFAESVLVIPAALKNGDWPLFDQDLEPVIQHKPDMPLTTLQKRWLKALLLDPRIALFAPDTAGLEDVEPLYQPKVFVRFDQYADGDPYEDEGYISRFRTALQAIREKRRLKIRLQGHTGTQRSVKCIPYRLEYSAKDDKFRLLAVVGRKASVFNLARLDSCEILEAYSPDEFQLPPTRLRELVMLLHDERNALERVLLHFSHFQKETQRLDERLFQIKLHYEQDDEAELLVRVLSFGPVLEVKSPARFITLVKERIEQQFRLPMPPVPPPSEPEPQ